LKAIGIGNTSILQRIVLQAVSVGILGYCLVLLCQKIISTAIAPMATGTPRQVVRQNDHEFPCYGGNGICARPLRPEGGTPAAANLRAIEVTQSWAGGRGRRGEKNSSRPPGSRKRQYTGWHDGENPASPGPQNDPGRFLVLVPGSHVQGATAAWP
jgi:hypothetical protein